MDNNGPEYINRTYRLTPELAERIKALAVKHEIFDSSLVCFLLGQALDQVDAGRLVIRRRAVAFVIDDPAARSL